MIETYYAGCYWLARPDSAETFAERAEHFLHLLKLCDPAWTFWYEKTTPSIEEAHQRPFPTDAANFRKLFTQKDNHFGDLLSFHLWTGDSEEETSLVDARSDPSSLHLGSACVLNPFEEGPVGERMLTASVMTEVLRAMALAWEPEFGVVTSNLHPRMVMKGFPDAGTFVGWVMYFSRMRGTVPPLPAPVRIERVEDKGTLVILTPERFTVSNAEHVVLAARVQELLSRAGLLRPLQPWPTG